MTDLYKIPTTLPVSELSKHPDGVFAQLSQGHLLITRQGKAAGVLVHPTVWNRILERLDNDEATIWALEAELKLAKGESELIDISEETLQQWLQATKATVKPGKVAKATGARVPADALPA
jgi:Antitoxin Phd_YefM, type II toxin-antitoxin system